MSITSRLKMIMRGIGIQRSADWNKRWDRLPKDDQSVLTATSMDSPQWTRAHEAIRQFVPTQLRMALELGSGSGKSCIALAQEYREANIVGIDSSLEAISLSSKGARLRRLTNCYFVTGKGEKMPFHSDSFDLTFSVGVVEHFLDPAFLLREQVRVLRPGGCLVVSVPNLLNPFNFLYRLYAGDSYSYGIERLFLHSQMETYLQDLGLKNIQRSGWSLFYRLTRLYRFNTTTGEVNDFWFSGYAKSLGEWLDKYLTPMLDRISAGKISTYFGHEIIVKGEKPS
ncbi:MAG: class I SAM-dependent methyltransferase [Candidatus Margulisiibacteriota bacterium]